MDPNKAIERTIDKTITDTLDAMYEGCLVEFVLEINRSIGIILDEDIYTVLGVEEDIDCHTQDEVGGLITGLILGAREINIFTHDEVMKLAKEGYFKREIKPAQ